MKHSNECPRDLWDTIKTTKTHVIRVLEKEIENRAESLFEEIITVIVSQIWGGGWPSRFIKLKRSQIR